MDVGAELRELARNLWWTWQPNAIALFRDLDPALWRAMNHNPIAFLAEMPPKRLEERAMELALEARISHTFHRLNEYLGNSSQWGHVHAGPLHARPVAYFSAEFGLHESIPVYSGGLGILAGDHLKSASDLGIPIVGVGLLYAQGYFNQTLDAAGWQQESYLQTDTRRLPAERITTGADRTPLRVALDTRAGRITFRVWRVAVGRSTLILLDSDVLENSEGDRALTSRLYGGDAYTRIRQEYVLGVGGMRALDAMGIRPGVMHLNEGHCAFALVEAARQEMVRDGVDFHQALRRVKGRAAFTTHTPVDAGHDRFDAGLVEQTLGPLRESLGISADELLGLGRVNPADPGEMFCMTTLALKCAWKSNAVSALHGHTSRRMWQGLWPGRSEMEVPIQHVTNGVHVASWIGLPMRDLFDTYLGADWEHRKCHPDTWQKIQAADDGELWEAHQIMKTRLVSYVQRQVCRQEAARGESGDACVVTQRRLDPALLTIGCARRFATYKRAHLILMDEKRLERLLCSEERPMQIVFAGKAHPHDDPGKHLIRHIFQITHDPRFMGRVVFLEDYDINVARHMIQGVDVWLNTPRRPREASGTSGMKAIFNGVLHLSILDGWWAEAYDGTNGFAVGTGDQHVNEDEQDRRDVASLYDLLEKLVVPLYYERDGNGVPSGWVARMKNAMRTLGWRFNADRMVMEYARECYLPSVGLASVAATAARQAVG